MNPIIKYGAAVGVVLAALAAAYMGGVHVTTQHYAAIIATNAKNAAEAQTKAISDVRAEEHASAAAQALIDRTLLDKANNEIISRDNTIAGLHSGAISLRQRFTCAAPATSVRSTTTSTGSSDAATQGGLQRADAEFLVRLASDADQVAIQLQACQAVVRADRKGQ